MPLGGSPQSARADQNRYEHTADSDAKYYQRHQCLLVK
jgi:hypothetical protein